MHMLMTDEGNWLTFNMIKFEICTKNNFSITYCKFYNNISKINNYLELQNNKVNITCYKINNAAIL
jgi:hypothetical protein